MAKSLFAVLVLLFGINAFAKTKEFCGKRDGTAGNAFLVDKRGTEVITLSQQGNSDALLEQADELIGKNSGVKGEEGTQNGKSYCVVAELNNENEPSKILKAWLKK